MSLQMSGRSSSQQRLRFAITLNPTKREIRGLPKDTAVSFVPMEAVREWGGIDASTVRSLGEVDSGYTYFREGDVLCAKITPCFENGKGAIASGLTGGIGFGTTEFHVLRATEILDPRYLFYVTISHPFRVQGEACMVGAAGQKRVPEDFIEDFLIDLPEIKTQQAIATYLDRKTAAIDSLIAKKQRLVELLQEKRQALITQAVTKGLDPSVPMKDSGVEWLGQIPAHWDVARVRHVARLESGHTPSRQHPEYWVPEECTIPWISLADVWQLRDGVKEYVESTAEKVSPIGLANSAARLLPAGTVILSRTASVGFSAIMPVPMATSQDFVNWVCGERINSEYMLYVLRAMAPEYDRLTQGSVHRTIYMPDVARFVTPIPPRTEQEAIVFHIRRQLGRLDAAAARVLAQIRAIQEYRQALITAAVTGKIDVTKEPQ